MNTRKYLPDQLKESEEELEKVTNKLLILEREQERISRDWVNLVLELSTSDALPGISSDHLENLRVAVNQRGKIIDAIGEADDNVQTCMEFFEMISKL
ncbi:hypothetical protein RRF57_012631 [Xylaria bambusicola]|uniref:Uncharacterized protein n=1 Tax=Xylaria bambusicola TaxID=326684 RepID=A0AAN7V5U4_9PEZI